MERAAEEPPARKDDGPPGLATGWTLGPGPLDDHVRQRTDVRSGGHRLDTHVHVLIVGDDSDRIAVPLTRDLAWAFPNLCFDRVDAPDDLPDYHAGLGTDDRVVLGVATSEVADIDALIDAAADLDALAPIQWIAVTDRAEHRDLARSTESDRLASVLKSPWTVPLLVGQSYSTMVRRLQAQGCGAGEVLDLIGRPPSFAVQGPLLEGLGRSEHSVVLELLEGVERVLGARPRLVVPKGTQLVTQGKPVGAVHLVLDGKVSLHRDSSRGEVLAHLASSGPLIGLVSLARGESAFFTGVTTTETVLVRLTTEQLQIVLARDPAIGSTLTALAIRSLTRRLMRAEDLHLENAMLAEDLEQQKQALAATLEDLRRTRAELVERARFAMLGELSAGIAHELNNPVTALVRAAEHLRADVDTVLAASSSTSAQRDAMTRALTAPPRSTAAERVLIKELTPIAGDRNGARRLVRAGVADAETARQLMAGGGPQVEAALAGARLGSSLRSVLAASARVIELTQSLKGYARPDDSDLKAVDVREGIDDVLRLTSHRVRGIRVECDYEDVPLVRAHPAKLQQVWTNLIINAAEAIEDENEDVRTARIGAETGHYRGPDPAPARADAPARITIRVRPDGDGVVVTVSDNGPGISPEVVDKIFEPHFTTKAGRVRFGLGMGMSIVSSIIADHSGTLDVDSRPGATSMRIRLPATPLPDNQPQREEES